MHHTHEIVAAVESSVVITLAIVEHIGTTIENCARSGTVH